MKRLLLWMLAAGAFNVLANAPCTAAPQRTHAKYITFDVPGAASGTFPVAINASGAVTGHYDDSHDVTHGFLRQADGTIQTFDVPDAFYTFPLAMNDTGEITGYYGISNTEIAGFVRKPNGKITAFQVPGDAFDTDGSDMNANGMIVGRYFDFSAGVYLGFVRSPGGKFRKFSVDKGGDTNPCCIDDQKTIAGTQIILGRAHGFVRDPDGAITTFDVPGISGGTLVSARSQTGWIAGNYYVSLDRHKSVSRGFERAPDGTFTTFYFSERGNISPRCVDANGTVAGSYNLKDQPSRGFLRTSTGETTTFRVPNATGGTVAMAINDADTITGWFTDEIGAHGYLRIP